MLQDYADRHHNGRIVPMMYYKCVVKRGSALSSKLESLAASGAKAPVWALMTGKWSSEPCSVPAHFPLRVLGAVQGPKIRPTQLGRSSRHHTAIT
jgi:hypothetical protein